MGLFDGNAKRNMVEDEILRAFLKQPILSDIVETVINHEKEWVTKCDGYYDNRIRRVTVGEDLFQIKWSDFRNDGEKRIEEVHGVENYSYTASGYLPLHNHINERGKVDVPVGRVIYLWCLAVHSRMSQNMPQCRFSEVTENGRISTFTYMVPQLPFKRWF